MHAIYVELPAVGAADLVAGLPEDEVAKRVAVDRKETKRSQRLAGRCRDLGTAHDPKGTSALRQGRKALKAADEETLREIKSDERRVLMEQLTKIAGAKQHGCRRPVTFAS